MHNPFLPQQLPPLCDYGQAPGRTLFSHSLWPSNSYIVVQALAPKYFNTRFMRVFVENVPFLVEKLGIKVLPCVICFIKGVTKDRQVEWLVFVLLTLTLRAELLASRNLVMWTASAQQPLNSGFYTQVGFSHILSKYRTLIRGFKALSKKIKIPLRLSNTHELWCPVGPAYVKTAMITMTTILTFESIHIHCNITNWFGCLVTMTTFHAS
jgi:hypothetical protein